MSSLIELLPKVVSEGRREANRILDGLSAASRITLQTNELIQPHKDRSQAEILNDDIEYVDDWKNRLIYGDNLLVMQALLAGDPASGLPSMRGKIDLIYIDPPYDSKADYRTKIELPGANIDSKPTVLEQFAYADTWSANIDGEDVKGTAAYLKYMYPRLVLMRELLSERGSIYVHMDDNIGSYLRVILDNIFGKENFRGEIIWQLGTGAKSKKFFSNQHNTIYCFSKSENWIFNSDNKKIREPFAEVSLNMHFKNIDENGRRYRIRKVNGKEYKYYADEGRMRGTVWTDISSMVSNSPIMTETTGYSTQKPEKLIELMMEASSVPGSIVADFFGGSGVTAAVASKLDRRFISVDVNVNSIQTTRDRLEANKATFDVMDVMDGIHLFRNPVQTMDKLKTLIPGLRDEESLDKFWIGAIHNARLGVIPVYVPDLKAGGASRLLDGPMMARILKQEIRNLPPSVKKVIVYYVEIDEEAVNKVRKSDKSTLVEIELRDLKEVLSDVVVDDKLEWEIDKEPS